MKYKGWLILTIILGFFYPAIWIASVVIAIIGIYADKKKFIKKVAIKKKRLRRKKKR